MNRQQRRRLAAIERKHKAAKEQQMVGWFARFIEERFPGVPDYLLTEREIAEALAQQHEMPLTPAALHQFDLLLQEIMGVGLCWYDHPERGRERGLFNVSLAPPGVITFAKVTDEAFVHVSFEVKHIDEVAAAFGQLMAEAKAIAVDDPTEPRMLCHQTLHDLLHRKQDGEEYESRLLGVACWYLENVFAAHQDGREMIERLPEITDKQPMLFLMLELPDRSGVSVHAVPYWVHVPEGRTVIELVPKPETRH